MQQERIRAIDLNILLLSLGELGLRLSVLIPEAAQAEHLVEDEVTGQEDQETNQLDKGSPLDLLSVGVIEVVDDDVDDPDTQRTDSLHNRSVHSGEGLSDHHTEHVVEQNAKKALSIADRAYVLETGKIVLSGDAKELMNNESIKKAYLGE